MPEPSSDDAPRSGNSPERHITSVLSREVLPASVAIYLAVALAAFEGLAVGAALPDVAADLGNVSLLPWVLTGYLLTSGMATVVAGPLVDGMGVRLTFRWAVAVFSLAGFVAAFAPSMEAMVVVRLVQGAGGGVLFAAGIAAVSLVYPDHLIGRAFAANSVVWGVMSLAAPAIAGAMLTFLSWRWIFLVNLPLGFVALAVGWAVLPGPVEAKRPRIDLVGLLAVAAFTSTTVLAVDNLGRWSLAWLAVSVAIAGWYLRRARRIDEPVVRPRHVVEQPYRGLGVGLSLLLVGAVACNIYVPLYVRAGREASAALAAVSVVFFVVGWTTGANLSGRLLDRHSETWLMVTAFAASIPGLCVVAFAAWFDAPLWVVFAGLYVTGSGVGVATNAGLTLVRSVTPPAEIGRASAAHQFFRNQGFTYGSALGGAIILVVVAAQVGDTEVVREIIAGSEIDAGVAAEAAHAVRRGFAATGAVGLVTLGMGFSVLMSLRRHLAPARADRRGTS